MSRWHFNTEKERECYKEGERHGKYGHRNYDYDRYSDRSCDKAYYDGYDDAERERRNRLEEERQEEEREEQYRQECQRQREEEREEEYWRMREEQERQE